MSIRAGGEIHQDLGARYSVGIHWGVFELTDEPLDEPPQKLAEARALAGIPRTVSSSCVTAQRASSIL